VERGGDDPCLGFEREAPIHTGQFPYEPAKTTRAVSAHFTYAPVAVIEFPAPIRFAGIARSQQDETVRADAAVAITDPNDLLGADVQLLCSIINEHEVIAGTVHLGEIQKHGVEKYR
jgi:hypothetical protein